MSLFELLKSPFIALDLETTGLNPRKDSIIMGVIAANGNYQVLSPKELPILKDYSGQFIIHNAKFDLAFLYHKGINLCDHKWLDTTILDHLRNENDRHSLEEIVKRYNWDTAYKSQFWGQYKHFQDAPYTEQVKYASKDVLYTYDAFFKIMAELQRQKIPQYLIESMHALARELLNTELNGLKIDTEYLTGLKTKYSKSIEAIKSYLAVEYTNEISNIELNLWDKEKQKRKTIKGQDAVIRPKFNFSSNKQLGELLYEQLKLPEQTNKKTKSRTVDDTALTKLKHPIIGLLQDLRTDEKIYGTYIANTERDAENGRLYPSFKVNGTVTGRISCESPNMQNWPRDGAIRGIIVPDDGNLLISADFSMLEVVVAAHYSQDANLLKIIYDGASKHDITAAALKIDRQTAKTLNFAMQYLCSPFKVAEIMKCSKSESEYIHKKYWETYKGEKHVIDSCKELVKQNKPIINIAGRHRRISLSGKNQWQIEAAYREAYSSLIQGSGADITHWAFINTSQKLRKSNIGKALFEIHDEILAEGPNSNIQQVGDVLQSIMNAAGNHFKLSVTLKSELGKPKQRWEK